MPAFQGKITQDMATLLLTGLITDTRSFQNPNTTPHSLEVAAQLLELGARQQEIIQNIYKTKPLSTLRIWGRALNRIQIDPAAHIVWSAVSKEDLAEMEAHSKETHGILDELISTIPDADVHVLFTELEEGGLKASMRSSAAIDSSALAGKLYGGGGHARAAGFRVRSFDNFSLQVLDCVSKLKEEMARQRKEAEAELPHLTPVTPVPPATLSTSVPSKEASKPAPIDVVRSVQDEKPNTGGERDIIQDLTK